MAGGFHAQMGRSSDVSGRGALRPSSAPLAAFLAATLLALPFLAQPAEASSLCRQLNAQLASAGRPAAGAQVRRFDQAIRSQQIELDKTRTQAANAGCGGFLGALRGQCNSLNAAIVRMENHLANLRQQRGALGGADPRRERARIEAALDANGCRATRNASARDIRRPRDSDTSNLFERLYGGKPAAQAASPGQKGPRRSGSGNYRTLCVRTCDGYFFPVAYSSSPDSFDRDQKACEAACPGTDVELFRHRVPGQEAEQAVSTRTGLPYTELANAFLYRKTDYSRPQTCGCNLPKGFSVIAGGSYARPEPIPATAEARDTVAVVAQDVADLFASTEEVESDTITSSVEAEAPAERRVRVVGPTFLPDPEEAIDLRVRGRRAAP